MDNQENQSSNPETTEQPRKVNEQIFNFLLHAISQNKVEIAEFLFDKCSDCLDDIFADDDGKFRNSLIYASSKGYEQVVELILHKGEGKINQKTVELALAASEGKVKDILFEKVTLDKEAFERLMFSSIDKGDLDSVKRLFNKQK